MKVERRLRQHLIAIVLSIGFLLLTGNTNYAGNDKTTITTEDSLINANVTISTEDEEGYTWYNGDRQMRVWLALDEIAIFHDQTREQSTKELKNTVQSLYPNAKTVETNTFVSRIRFQQQFKNVENEAKLSVLKIKTGARYVSPVFYPNPQKKPSTWMALTGEIIVHFNPDWDSGKITAWAKNYGLRLIKKFDFTPDAYLFASDAGMDSLKQANKIYVSGEVLYSYPNWLETLAIQAIPNDPLFIDQWHLHNTGQGGCTVDVNITNVWDTYTGTTNERIVIVDEDLKIGHEDLSPNIIPGQSWDYLDGDSDPTGRDLYNDKHGTSVAGVAAARGNNGIGVTGAAFTAGLVGHRLIGAATFENQADALTRNYSTNDIYNNSWGPGFGVYLSPLLPIVESAFRSGVTIGRGGKGVIYIFANGNKGNIGGNSNDNGLVNSRYTIAVAASTCSGVKAAYSEKGANIVVNAPSNGGNLGITTTDRSGSLGYSTSNYFNNFSGTSSAAPLVSGIIALMLQANPNLGWRDVQKILVTTAYKNDPTDPDWETNGAGLHINHKYGFGRIDAQAAVTASTGWSNLPEEITIEASTNPNIPVPDSDPTGVSDTINISQDINVEYVEIYFTSTHVRYTDLDIRLTSPSGTESILTEKRSTERYNRYNNWRFGTIRHYGESSSGNWTLTVKDFTPGIANNGNFQSWTINIYGGGCNNAYEPNDTFSQAYGPLTSGTITTATLFFSASAAIF
ncbi:MAG: S8 family serine peptidase [Candidatus Scalindua sp.]|nr:S8 family serine peptidase [Candidatus Scalindua sp.]